MDILAGLNDAQKQAVMTDEGPLLILAGAGSGKTKTLTHRIAYLLQHKNIWPNQILAVTFTNKAAAEMRQRLWQLTAVGNDVPRRIQGEEPAVEFTSNLTAEGQTPPRNFMPWMGTFHGICVRLLRHDGQYIDIPSNFVIYDEDDRQGLIKQAMKTLGIGDTSIKPRVVSGIISTAKNQMIGPDEFAASAHYPFQKNVAKIYAEYETQRKVAKALDFDDLLLETVRLLKDVREVRAKWQKQFHYIMIDEYQDTNAAQYQIVRSLVNEQKNICVVGDDWQSIYSWRGADFTNILNFERDFTGATVIKLEQNYRSTGAILTAAQNVISKNKERTDKKLWTAESEGAPVQVHQFYDEVEEASSIVARIAAQTQARVRKPSEFAVLYRTNAQSYTLERALLQLHVPYHIVGGVRFYDRKEIKDVLAYLRLIYQPNDRMSFSRIANVPTRGIGPTSIERFLVWQAATGMDIHQALQRVQEADGLTARAKNSLHQLGSSLASIKALIDDGLEPSQVIDELVRRIGYLNYLRDGSPQAEDREENISSLISDAKAFVSLEDFLQEAALMSSADESSKGDSVTLMTLHAAKGLEFPVVFIAGLEEGIFPHSRIHEAGPSELEEERRLCYVGMTRARQELHMTYAASRLQFGQRGYNMPSRFLEDMGIEVMHAQSATQRHDDSYSQDVYDAMFEVGDRVRSAQFGPGEIIDVDGLAVSILFDSGQTKKLNVEYAHLSRL